MTDINEAQVRKLLHRRIKDISVSADFRNFIVTLLCMVAIIYYLKGMPNLNDMRLSNFRDVKKHLNHTTENE